AGGFPISCGWASWNAISATGRPAAAAPDAAAARSLRRQAPAPVTIDEVSFTAGWHNAVRSMIQSRALKDRNTPSRHQHLRSLMLPRDLLRGSCHCSGLFCQRCHRLPFPGHPEWTEEETIWRHQGRYGGTRMATDATKNGP